MSAALLFLTSCEGRGDPKLSVPSGRPGAALEWVSVFAVGEPDELEEQTARITEEAPKAVAVSPSTCWKGLPEALDAPSGSYVAAVVGVSRAAVERTGRRVGLPVLLTGRFAALCGD